MSNKYFVTDGNGAIIELTKSGKEQTKLIVPEEINGEKITEIGDWSFYFHPSLISVTIPDTVTSIGMNAFRNCIKLKEIKLSENIHMIYKGAFSGCINLESINIPKDIRYIGDFGFYRCPIVSRSMVPETTVLGQHVFSTND